MSFEIAGSGDIKCEGTRVWKNKVHLENCEHFGNDGVYNALEEVVRKKELGSKSNLGALMF